MSEYERLEQGYPPSHLTDDQRQDLLALALPNAISSRKRYNDIERPHRISVVLTHPELTDYDLAKLMSRRPNHLEARHLVEIARHPGFSSNALGEFARTYAEYTGTRRYFSRERMCSDLADNPAALCAVRLASPIDFVNELSAGEYGTLIEYIVSLGTGAQEVILALCSDFQERDLVFAAETVCDAIEVTENMFAVSSSPAI
jgi:hypothetical protein